MASLWLYYGYQNYMSQLLVYYYCEWYIPSSPYFIFRLYNPSNLNIYNHNYGHLFVKSGYKWDDTFHHMVFFQYLWLVGPQLQNTW